MDSILNDFLGSAQLSVSLIIPVVVVIISAVLVFICGFRKPKEPQFRKIAATVEVSTKKTKRKEKPQASSTKQSTTNGATKAPAQQASSTNEGKKQPVVTKKQNQPQQQAAPKKKDATQKKSQASEKMPATTKKEKAPKSEKVKKPADFDDDGWVTVPSRTDKKKNKEDLLLSQALNTALSQAGKKAEPSKSDKSSKNPKQLKDQVNKSKKEAADNNNKKNNASTESTEQVNNKVVDTIENLVNELKKKDSNNELITPAPIKKQKDVDSSAGEKTDDSKPVLEGGLAFNEMEDTWTEAKAPKKGKKKARKD